MSRMRQIVFVGGGSGGHVTPLIAIAKELKKKDQNIEITLITDRSFYAQTKVLVGDQPLQVRKIFAGKYRRYYGKSFFWHIRHLPTLLSNIRDIFFLVMGVVQSVWYFLRYRPELVFCKGGYVCVPVGIVAHFRGIPLVIHDSDTHPGLTNRFLAPWATYIATGMPTEYYQYPSEKMIHTGIPVHSEFQPSSAKERRLLRAEHGLTDEKPLLLVTGGGTGAHSLNMTLAAIAEKLLVDGWEIVHFTGSKKASRVLKYKAALPESIQPYWHVEEFGDVLPYTLMADVVVSRAGATAMQEFANAKKPVVVVPNPHLTGGHQLKNAQMFAKKNAVEMISQDVATKDPLLLYAILQNLLSNDSQRKEIANTLHKEFAKPHAAIELADIVLKNMPKKGRGEK